MNHKLWSVMILGGLLVAGAGLSLPANGLAAQVVALLLLTVGLCSCLGGLVGASGLMAWLPGLEAVPARRAEPE